MKLYLKITCLILLLGVVDCRQRHPDLSDYERYKRDDPDRRRTLDDSRRRFGGPTCSETKRRESTHECVAQCKEIYNRGSDRTDCEDLPIEQITLLAELFETLKSPSQESLEDIELEDLKVYLNVSRAGFEHLIRDITRSGSEEILAWIATDEVVAEVFIQEDVEKTILRKLLKILVGFADNTIYKPFQEHVRRSKTLITLAIEEKNELALDWFHKFIVENNNHCNKRLASVECLEVFCHIGKNMDDADAKNWLDFEEFKAFISGIIDNKINGHTSVSTSFINKCWFENLPSYISESDARRAVVLTGPSSVNNFYVDVCRERTTLHKRSCLSN